MKERIALIHVYQLREAFDGSIQPSKRGLIQACAAYELARRGEIDTIFIAGGNVWGEEYPPFSRVLAEQMQQIGVRVPINAVSSAMDTPQEIDEYLKMTADKPNSQYIFIANRTHLDRIKDRVASRGIANAEFIAAEDVLKELPYFKKFIEEFERSEIENKFKKREARVRFVYRLGLEKFFTFIAKKGRKRRFSVDFDE